ncbi:usp-48, partial [Pristionchus pacificus]
MVAKLSAQKYNGTRGKADLLKRIAEKLLKVHPDDIDVDLVWNTYGLGQRTCGKHAVSNPKSTNCKENPYCLGRLGLEKFEKLIKSSEAIRNEKMTEMERRDSMKQPCGLVNSANFCYVNSFLQIWFNDPVFRQIIYDWLPSPAYLTPAPPAMDVQKVMNTLQHLFFTLDTTPYEDANGEEFCTALRLNQEQQDAQEFTVMFFDSIDRNLMKHPNGRMMRERIGERFNGLQTSTLRCRCGHHSDNTTKFSALNLSIDGHTTLSASIKGYFADERLDDFACSGCGKRGGVARETRIDHLPPVLLLSLNRYVYDSSTGRRKKLKTPLQYPRLLSVDGLPHSERLSEEDSRYELSAVMVHEGDNADCGHYWDIIRHPHSGVWFKYNDKIVKETKAPGVETERVEAPAKPAIDLKYCYGLVYRRKESLKPPKDIRPPPEEICGRWTKEMDHKFYRMTDTDAQASELTLQEVTQRFRVVGEHMAALEVKPDRANQKRAKDLAFLPTKLLADILSTEYARANQLKDQLQSLADELDRADCEKEEEAAAGSQSDVDLSSPQKRKKNVRRRVKSMYDKRLEQVEIAMSLSPTSITLCPHERISYESVLSGEVKAVNRAGAEKLIKDYGLAVNVVTAEGVARSDRLRTGLEVCTECVQEKTRDVHFGARLEDDAQLALKIAKDVNARCSVKAFFSREPPADSFYVAKSALGSFKKDAQSERQRSNLARRTADHCTWTIGSAEVARAERGEDKEKRRRKRAGAVEREMAGGGEEEEPVSKCPRSDREEVKEEENGKEEEEGEEMDEEDKETSEEVEETIRDLMDELAGPSRASTSQNGHDTGTTTTSASAVSPSSAREMKMEVEVEEEHREAAGRDTGKKVKKEVKEEEEE